MCDYGGGAVMCAWWGWGWSRGCVMCVGWVGGEIRMGGVLCGGGWGGGEKVQKKR